MPRPKQPRRICFEPNVTYFKPRGVPLRELREVRLLPDELEALRLHDVEGLEQVAAAGQLKVSQPTFGRIINSAYRKVAQALVRGEAIRVETKGEGK
jgi:uncharacterized protein